MTARSLVTGTVCETCSVSTYLRRRARPASWLATPTRTCPSEPALAASGGGPALPWSPRPRALRGAGPPGGALLRGAGHGVVGRGTGRVMAHRAVNVPGVGGGRRRGVGGVTR